MYGGFAPADGTLDLAQGQPDAENHGFSDWGFNNNVVAENKNDRLVVDYIVPSLPSLQYYYDCMQFIQTMSVYIVSVCIVSVYIVSVYVVSVYIVSVYTGDVFRVVCDRHRDPTYSDDEDFHDQGHGDGDGKYANPEAPKEPKRRTKSRNGTKRKVKVAVVKGSGDVDDYGNQQVQWCCGT